MKKWGYAIAGAAMAFTISAISSGIAAQADPSNSAAPGTDGDPVVTKSYVDQVKTDLLSVINSIKSQPAPQNPAKPQTPAKPQAPVPAPASSGTGDLVVEKVPPGKTIIGYAGTEFIVRVGTVTAVTQAGDGYGLPDITGGSNLDKGQEVPHNHLILLPYNDGRGVKAQTSAYVMIRGKYSIQ
ncbi:hypothetical protein PP175_23495 [Aneurinibacillus sp. Ricciae_BoGa-3]|uniref:hypothetical protein n=1 Tax=Aneurinibacillus sp. Ricciae_BoGa-3 TaxID=3022697 RepID=UPI002340C392|nr:hypothetical protein [Aneurinibacillus sp. Ricciae_BoGa-3]WCK54217.1 hypothetical protein PP175_23495 [Aneurinibacillus sp. Ricciae_BoGa-3]